ncbi:LPXTG cell wall anchor domain-containing protein [Sutcliffiella horikoshii]|uniref:LPXTG cell wall anchor domain-containing protein n=1 Tax=Sutcliffiella horikoshii TaxID=79883 RepID=UPI00384CDF5C
MKLGNKLSFISGLTAFTLLFSPIAMNVNAEGKEADDQVEETELVYLDDVRSNVYEEEVTEDAYGVTQDAYGVTEDAYGVTDDTYGVTEDAYGVTDDAYGVTEDAYGVTEDTYGVTEDAYGVPGDVYEFNVTDIVYGVDRLVKDKKTNTYEFTPKKKGTSNTIIVSDAVLAEMGKGSSIKYSNQHVTVKLAVNDLPSGKTVKFLLDAPAKEILDANQDSLSNLVEFKVMLEDGSLISEFKDGVTLEFFVDPTKVKNWNDLKVVYVNDKGEKVEEITPTFDKKTGKVTATVYHFSVYGVFEIASVEDAEEDVTPVTDKEEKEDTEEKEEKEEVATPPATEKEEKKEDTTKKETAKEKAGHKLPNTATNTLNYVVYGAVMVLIGGVFFLTTRKKVTA